MSQREIAATRLWCATVEAFVNGRMSEARNFEARLTSVEQMTDAEYTEPKVGAR